MIKRFVVITLATVGGAFIAYWIWQVGLVLWLGYECAHHGSC